MFGHAVPPKSMCNIFSVVFFCYQLLSENLSVFPRFNAKHIDSLFTTVNYKESSTGFVLESWLDNKSKLEISENLHKKTSSTSSRVIVQDKKVMIVYKLYIMAKCSTAAARRPREKGCQYTTFDSDITVLDFLF